MSRPSARLTLGLLVAGCEGAEQALLTEMASFHGAVRIERTLGDQATALAGELTFDRSANRLGLVHSARDVRLSKVGDGPLEVFEGGQARTADAEDVADFQLLWLAVHGQPDERANVRRKPGRYEIELEPFLLRVELEPVD